MGVADVKVLGRPRQSGRLGPFMGICMAVVSCCHRRSLARSLEMSHGAARGTVSWLSVFSQWCAAALIVCLTATASTAQTTVSARGAVADSARLDGDGKLTRFVAGLSEDVAFEVFTLPNPYRVVVDLPEVDFKMPAEIGRKAKGLVKAFRFGLFQEGRARIVLDVTGPVRVKAARTTSSSFFSSSVDLVLDIVPATVAEFAADQAERMARERARAALRVPAPERVAQGALARQRGKTVVVLDAGHGGIDSGAIGRRGTRESDIVLAFMKELRSRLAKNPKYEVMATRDRDVFIKLGDRVKFARRNGASLFISLHADSISRRWANRVRGATVYTLSDRGSDSLAREIARSNNQSDVLAGVEIEQQKDAVSSILYDLAQRETNTRSELYANIALKHIKKAARLNRRPHRSAAFRVLKSPDVPSVLVELGYLSNLSDEKLLKSGDWRSKVADQIAASVDDYFSQKFAGMPF